MKKAIFILLFVVAWFVFAVLWLAPASRAFHTVPFYAEDVADPNVFVILDSSGSMTNDMYGCTGRTITFDLSNNGTIAANETNMPVTEASPSNCVANRIGITTDNYHVGDAGGLTTFGDGSGGNLIGVDRGTPNPPSTMPDGLTNDSRLYIAKQALTNMINGMDGVRFALSRYYQANANEQSYYYRTANYGENRVQTLPYAAYGSYNSCTNSPTSSNTGKLLRDFPSTTGEASNSNYLDILAWLNNSTADGVELRANGRTPLGGIMTWANSFLTTTRNNDPATCRRHYVVLITDGSETCGGDPTAAATTLHNNGFDVFVLGFAFPAGSPLRGSINSIAVAGGTDADADGDGVPTTGDAAFFANNPQQLQDALNAIMGHIKRGNFSRSAPTLSSDGRNLYAGFFNMPGWKGHLQKFGTDADGNVLDPELWDAGNLIPAVGGDADPLTITSPSTGLWKTVWGSRILYAPSSANNETQFLNGVNPATAVTISCPATESPAPNAQESAKRILKFTMNPGFCGGLYKGARDTNWRLGDIYHSEAIAVGPPRGISNDTEYQTFKSANAGRETVVYIGANDGSLHAFTDNGVEKWVWVPANLLGRLRDQRNGHQFYVDSSPTVRDVYINGSWKTVLISGQRQGGNYYFAIDVTDPNNPRPLWEFTHERLGETWSKPAIGKLSTGQWVAFVGGGRQGTVGCTSSTTGCATTLLVIDIATGNLVNSTTSQLNKVNVGDLVTSPNIINGLVAPPRTLERTIGIVDTVFIGDLDGRMWKLDVSSSNPSSWDKCLLYDPGDADGLNRRPIYHDVTLFYLGSDVYVAFGTGDERDPASNTQERVYVVKDPGQGSCPTPSGSLAAFWYTGKSGTNASNIPLALGEKILGRPIAYNKKLLFTTYTSTNVCATGRSKYYEVTLTEDPLLMVVTAVDLGVGVASKIVVSPSTGQAYTIVIDPAGDAGGGGGGKIRQFDVGRISFVLKSWREIF